MRSIRYHYFNAYPELFNQLKKNPSPPQNIVIQKKSDNPLAKDDTSKHY